ncbi:MAG: phosphoglycerate dehydrogenase, partial [Comamonadaceae bacterium]
TQESQENIGREVAEKLVRYVQAGTTKGAVNFPELPFIEQSGKTRILHVHRNVPGALGTLDNMLATHGLNIVSQSLQTKGQIGYAVTDVDNDVDDIVLAALRDHPITVRCERA